MKALSIRQPWAWLILHGYKDIENRTWQTSYRGVLAIHASKTVDRQTVADIGDIGEITLPTVLPTGGIVGLATLTDCVTSDPSPWFYGPIGWILTDPVVIDPLIPLRGRLGLFNLSPDIVEIINSLAQSGQGKS